MTQADLYGPNWLLSYEANIKGWLPSVKRGDHVKNDPNFQALKNWGVSFYSRNRTLDFTPVPTTDDDYLGFSLTL